MTFALTDKTIFVAGHKGMVGSAVCRRLAGEPCQVITVNRPQLDLLDQAQVFAFLKAHKPDAVIVAAAKVGGILANASYPADFLYQNLQIQNNLIMGAHYAGIDRLLFLGSSCIYPKFAPQPIAESSLLTGPLEPTNESYAIAKIAGIKLCDGLRKQQGRDYISAMPTNLYGPHDNFDLETSHVLPALMRKAHEAKIANTASLKVWGSGRPLREFMYVDDLADALVFLLQAYSAAGAVNVGTGTDISIKVLATLIASIVGFEGRLEFDSSKPDGTPRKLMDSSKLARAGWTADTSLEDGIRRTYTWYLENAA